MIRRALTILALLAIPTAGFAQDGAIEGTVRSDDSGIGLGNARVEIPALGLVSFTGATGGFSLTGVPAGTHTLEVRLLGYGLQTLDATVASGQTVNVDIVLGIAAFELNELVVVGSRTRPRTVTESMVPVDVIPVTEIARQAETNIDFLLRNVVPSYNVNIQPISDAATITRPANLRGLASDHTLVLVNGKRRHRGAVISWLGGGLSDGAQGPDIGAIPGIALRQVEVLRDGASAQYGSDAIAGVLNFQLKNDRSGGSVQFKQGAFLDGDEFVDGADRQWAGDGRMTSVAGNFGVPLGQSGFANVSVEYSNQEPTDRAIQRTDAAALVAAGNTAVRTPTAQVWGSPRVSDDVKVFLNTGFNFDDDEQVYAFGNIATKRVDGGFFFRNPNTRGSVFSGDGGATLLIGDVLQAKGLGTANCPVVKITNNVPDPVALQQVFDDPNCFSFQEMFPGGFTPQFGGEVFDATVVGGVRGRTDGGITWDASTSWGRNLADFFIYNTVNAALGPETPTDFDPGFYNQEEINFNLDLSYQVNDVVNVAAGFEQREERFEIGQGQDESWQIGPYAEQGFSSSSNGFPGFSPLAAGDWTRNNTAVYADINLGGGDDPWVHRRRGPLRGLLRFRRQGDRKGLVPIRGHRPDRVPRQRQHRLPRAHAGSAERLQRLDRFRHRSRRPGESRHHSFNLRGGQDPRRQAARARELGEHDRRDHVRVGRLPLDCGLLPHRDLGSLRADQHLQAHARRGHQTGLGRGDERRQPRRVPLLHQRLRDAYPGHRPSGELLARRSDQPQPALQLHRHQGDRAQSRGREPGARQPA